MNKRLIKIGASWCAPCRAADKFISPLLKTTEVEYIHEDAGAQMKNMPKLKAKYAPFLDNTRSIPTFLLQDDSGVKVLRGFSNEILNKIKLWSTSEE